MNPGSIVSCRNREWVLMPSDREDVQVLRPLTGASDDVVAIHKGLSNLIAYSLPEERIRSATFPLPTSDDVADAASAQLLWQAARLTLRDGAAPFRSIGRISIRPRIFQFVPLLMALRLDPVRLLIADDVGVGKTIEALLIARELLDRGEIRRICILCPPCLCEQWQKELAEKFNLDAAVIRSGTVSQLERPTVGRSSIYQYYPVQVASIDFIKTDRNRHQFLQFCPDLVIVDEAHGSASSSEKNQTQHQRHQLVREIAARENQHLIMLTATPHSGIENAFRSLLSLLKQDFGAWDTSVLNETQRIELAKHFVQRTRRDIEHDWEGEHCFPNREPSDEIYRLSPAYKKLFEETYAFCSEMVKSSQSLKKRQQRVRYWAALALLRCVMSSPAAAVASLANRHDSVETDDDEPDFRSFIFESSEDRTYDEQPTTPIESAESTLGDGDRRKLKLLGQQAAKLLGSTGDTKMTQCSETVSQLLLDGFQPIIWCRYIATADYLAEKLQKSLRKTHPKVKVVSITGRLGDEERRAKVDELSKEPVRVLVATDCLSEGINLQHAFNAVLHYDLPWNPNRLEQREGRVDRYGQNANIVRAIRYFSPDSAVDGVVLEVLLNKAREIHRTLGTHVPVPDDGESVTEALLNSLFLRAKPQEERDSQQMLFNFDDVETDEVKTFHQKWERDAEREKISRSRFAQRSLKPAEVRDELESTDKVLGDPEAVREFVINASQRLGIQLTPAKKTKDASSAENLGKVYVISTSATATAILPDAIRLALPKLDSDAWRISFTSPTPDGAEYLGRNHSFVVALARFLMEEALVKHGAATATRCGVIRTNSVTEQTTIYLLRVRYLLEQPERAPLLSEEVLVMGFESSPNKPTQKWLDDTKALELLGVARPDANLTMSEKKQVIESALEQWPVATDYVHARIMESAAELEKSHKRVRQAVSLKVRQLHVAAQLPADLLGILVLVPVEK